LNPLQQLNDQTQNINQRDSLKKILTRLCEAMNQKSESNKKILFFYINNFFLFKTQA